MGLRAEKQQSQRSDLIENAFAYMCEHDGHLPTMAELARICRVSDATVFNYVGQRDALLAELAHRSLAGLADASAESGSLRRTVRSMGRELERRSAEHPEVWLRIWAASTPVDPSLGRPGCIARGEAGGAHRLVCLARERGELRQDVDSSTQAGALVSTWLGALAAESTGVHGKGGSVLDHEAWRRVEAAVDLVLDGLRRRNERVRVKPGASATSPASASSSASGRAAAPPQSDS